MVGERHSLRAEYALPIVLRAFGRPLDWVGYGGYAGFFGANRNALGFTAVAELGAGVELPVSPDRERSERMRLALGDLFGADVKGWTVGVSLQY